MTFFASRRPPRWFLRGVFLSGWQDTCSGRFKHLLVSGPNEFFPVLGGSHIFKM
jgi:hypothetical protein